MKQPTFRTELQKYFDVDALYKTIARHRVCSYFTDCRLNQIIEHLGGDDRSYNQDFMYEVIDYEEDCKNKGIEPVRSMHFRNIYEDGEPEEVDYEPNDRVLVKELVLDYTQEDYDNLLLIYLMQNRDYDEYRTAEQQRQSYLVKYFNDDAQLIRTACMSALQYVTKDDLKDFSTFLQVEIEEFFPTEEERKATANVLYENNAYDFSNMYYFLMKAVTPFVEATVTIHTDESKSSKINPNELLSFIFCDGKLINNEIKRIARTYHPTVNKQQGFESNDAILERRCNKLAQSKETNALTFLNLQRDHKDRNKTSSRSGRKVNIQEVFENNDVEITFGSSNDISFTTQTRMILDLYGEKLTAQIPHKCGDLNVLDRQRSVTFTLEEVEACFKKNGREARKMLNNFYDEVRDIKIRAGYWYKDEDGNTHKIVRNINLFDADEVEVVVEENARPEDVPAGKQITLLNNGIYYNHKKQGRRTTTGTVKNGRLTMRYNIDFARHISQSPTITHNPNSYRLDGQKYRPAYYINRYLEQHAHMNRGKRNENLVSLETLLKNNPEIPTYDEVANGNRNFTDRIKTPLVKNIKALKDSELLNGYFFIDDKGKKITETKLLSLAYAVFKDCKLQFDLAVKEDNKPE